MAFNRRLRKGLLRFRSYTSKPLKNVIKNRETHETETLLARISRLEKDPSQAIPWKTIRRNGE